MKKFLYLFIFLILNSCVNPTLSTQSEIEVFKKKYPEQIKFFVGKEKTMQYATAGNPQNRPLVFVHGSPGSWEGWVHFLLDSGLQSKFQIIAIDRPGYGGSNPGVAEISLAKQASDIIEVLKFNQSHLPAILVGHSFGGPVIAKMAIDYPSQVAGLVFVASSVSPELEFTKWYQYPANWWPLKVLIPTALRICNQEILPLKGELEKLLPEWKNISTKVALIHGQKDDLVPFANQKFLSDHLLNSQIVKTSLIPDMNHFVPWMHPELITESINEVNNAIK